MSSAGETLPTSPDDAGADMAFVGGDDDSVDLAKTQKFERRSYTDELDEETDDAPGSDDDLHRPDARRRRSRKGKRRTVKIPDDNVPSTPTPPAVTAAQHGLASDGDDDAFDAAATIQRPMVALGGGFDPTLLTGSGGEVPSGTIPVIPSPVPPPRRLIHDDEIYDAPTVLRPPPDDELRARLAALPDPTEPDEPELDPHRRESAPGIYTDDSSIAVLRPVQVINSLPPMQAESVAPADSLAPGDSKPPPKRRGDSGQPGARRPLPPPRAHLASDAILEEIEEIIPDRMSLPGPTPETAAELANRPATVDPSGDTAQQPPMSAAEADLALAEARAREAEAKAVALEARAKEAAAKADAARNKTARPPKKPWYQVIFEDELVRTFDNPKKADVEKESTFIEGCLRLDKGSRILDLACGSGVHAVELASRGYQIVGVDLSTTMLKLAEGYNSSRGTSVSFIQGDMRMLNLEGVFDGIYCWAASFGYFDDKQNLEVLERVARALRPGGMFALDVTNRDYVAPNSPSMAWFEKPGVVCMDEARFDFFTSRLHTKRMVLFDTGKSREVEMSMRLYTLTELGRLLQTVGFEVVEVSGHRAHRGAYFGSCSPRLIITSRRKGSDEKTDGDKFT